MFKQSFALSKFMGKQYFKNFQGTFFAFIFPLLMFYILVAVYMPNSGSGGVIAMEAAAAAGKAKGLSGPALYDFIAHTLGFFDKSLIINGVGMNDPTFDWSSYFNNYLQHHNDFNMATNPVAAGYVIWFADKNFGGTGVDEVIGGVPGYISLFKSLSMTNIISTLLPGMILLGNMSLCIVSSVQAIAKLKESVIIKRIGITPINKGTFIYSCISLYFTIAVVSSAFILLMGALPFIGEMNVTVNAQHVHSSFLPFAASDWLIVLGAWVANLFLCMSIGMLIVARVKTVETALAISMLVYFVGMFMGKILFQWDPSNTGMEAASRVIPFRAVADFLVTGWKGGSDEINKQLMTGSNSWKGIFDIVYVLGLAGTCSVLAGVLFKWTK